MNSDTTPQPIPDPPVDLNDHHDDFDSAEESGNDLDGIGKSATELININTKYQPEWGGAEAFRELYQNFKDGILKSFDIEEREYKPVLEESKDEVLVRVYHPTAREEDNSRVLCGFIRFRHDFKRQGVLEIVNFKAKLQRRHLGLGGTSKAKETKQAGQHGEGLKLAALIMRRSPQNHTFKIESSKFSWNFGFNPKKLLVCTITRVDPVKITQLKAQDRQRQKNNLPRKLEANVWEDVSIIIGEPRRCRTVAGDMRMSQKIPLKRFYEWLKTTIDIKPPENIIKTPYGDILCESEYANKIYLHGILLSDGNKPGPPFKYGYNLYEGKTSRDREALRSSSKEHEQFAKIWCDAIHQEESKKENSFIALDMYIDAFSDHCAETFNAWKYIPIETARLILDRLKKKYGCDNGREPFFYEDDNTTDLSFVRYKLNQQPVKIAWRLRRILKEHRLCSSTTELKNMLFKSLIPIQTPKDSYCLSVMVALRASFQSLDLPKTYQFEVVDIPNERFSVAKDGDRILVNAHYLKFEAWHETSTCESTGILYTDNTPFTCDHAIHSLMEDILRYLRYDVDELYHISKLYRALERTKTKLQYMPRGVSISPGQAPGELMVSWITMVPTKLKQKPIRVAMHKIDCKNIKYPTINYPYTNPIYNIQSGRYSSLRDR